MTVRDVVVLGATGRYSPLVPALLAAGHRVRAGARDPEAAARQGLDAGGAEIVRVDFEDVATIAAAAHGADALFAAGTAHRAGPAGDTKHGRNIVDAARLADVGHLVYVSVAGADQPSEVPLFESKRHLEEYLFASGRSRSSPRSISWRTSGIRGTCRCSRAAVSRARSRRAGRSSRSRSRRSSSSRRT